MPRELKSKEEFTAAAEKAKEIRIVKDGDSAKVKLRTDKGLLTFKTTAEDADAIEKDTDLDVVQY